MIDVSAFGASINIVATSSFPVGFDITQFADDEDPITFKDVESSGYQPLYDGSIFTFDKTAPILVSISTIPNSDDDINLKILLQMRKSTPHILPVSDVTTMVVTYGDGGRIVLSNGSILSGAIADSITSSGRKKGNNYHFAFGTFAGFQSATETVATLAQNVFSVL